MSDMMEAFMEMQRKQHNDFMQAEQICHHQELEIFSNWMRAQREMEEERLQQKTPMFQQLLTSLQRPSHLIFHTSALLLCP